MCRERFHHYCSDEKNIIARLLKFAVYINNYKILPGNILGLILKRWPPQVFFVSHEKCLYLPYYWSLRFGMVNQPVGDHGLGIFWCGQI